MCIVKDTGGDWSDGGQWCRVPPSVSYSGLVAIYGVNYAHRGMGSVADSSRVGVLRRITTVELDEKVSIADRNLSKLLRRTTTKYGRWETYHSDTTIPWVGE